MNHRERLIAVGLLTPLSVGSVYERDRAIERAKQSRGTKDLPQFCVFRRDEWTRHIILDGEKECKSAELIESKLFSYEAHVLCSRLNFHDKEQPIGGCGYYLGMYGVCSMTDWEEWWSRHAQIMLSGPVAGTR